MKRVFPFIVLLLCGSCTGSEINRTLDRAERCMDSHPDSALMIIESIPRNELKSGEQEARFALLKSIALEKNYIEVRSDTLIRKALAYYSDKDSPLTYRMQSFYYYGIVQMYGGNNPSAIVYLERAQRVAEQLNDNYYLGLIHRNKSSIYNTMANHRQAIEEGCQAIDCFQKAGKELHAEYARLSLAIDYFNDRKYDDAERLLMGLNESAKEITNKYYSRLLLGDIGIILKRLPEETIRYHRAVPLELFRIRDLAYRALAFERLSQPDSADYWFHEAYARAVDAADTAIVDNMRSDVEFSRGNYITAYKLVDNAMRQQDKYVRSWGLDALNMALKEYYQDELALETAAKGRERERTVWIGIVAAFGVLLVASLLISRIRRKNRELAEQMAQISVAEAERRDLQKENVNLVGALFSERIRNLDRLSRAYYTADAKEQREIVFATFKKNLTDLRHDKSVYQAIQEDLDRYYDGVYTKFITQVPSIKEDNLQIVILFFAGIPYETIELVSRRSKGALKSIRTRVRNAIKASGAPDAERFLELLEVKRRK